MPPSRNKPMGMEKRTLRNLDFIDEAHRKPSTRDRVHIVTQTMNSLLGLVILPSERKGVPYKLSQDETRLDDLYEQCWPRWELSPLNESKTQTLGSLARHLRNAAAHGRYTFDSDSLDPEEVIITVKDKPQHGAINWCASIRADELLRFCQLLGQHMANKHDTFGGHPGVAEDAY